jgi:hypothetical protein
MSMKSNNEKELKEIIIEDYNLHKSDDLPFIVEGKLDILGEYVDITNMFTGYYQIKELGIQFKATAKNEEGYDFLLDLGFPKSKITKRYE